MSSEEYHIPVLLNECIDALNIKPDGIYVDVTFGGGGHSKAILEKLGPEGRLYAFDQDADAQKNSIEDDRFQLIPQNFRYLHNSLRIMQIGSVDGILADLGVSSHQFNTAERGFSTRFEGPLDMRMNTGAEITASTIINTYSEKQLMHVFKNYGELRNAKQIVNALVLEREPNKMWTTTELMHVLRPLAGKASELNKFNAKVFQALRIEVNEEMAALSEMLNQIKEVLKPGGRLVVMSYHSLEDRLVKNLMKRGTLEGEIVKDFYGRHIKPFTEITKKPIVASDIENKKNPRARSAKLRIAQLNEQI